MTTVEQLKASPVTTAIANPGEWEAITKQIAAESGLPTAVTPAILTGMIGSAVPLLFEADAARDMDPLRGTFADAVIAQCQRNAGGLLGEQPVSVVINLIGAHMVEAHTTLRVRLAIEVKSADGSESVNSQFWDLQLGAEVTVGQATCPNCGAPIAQGALICEHCHADVRTVVKAPLVVSRLEMY
jgi:uncharacterized protein (UPF0212 family)